MEKPFYQHPEIWGGIECTINRVKNNFFDQLHYSGHYNRSSDILEISKLGIKKLRYPVLWEKHQPGKNDVIDWSWTREQLDEIRNNHMDVIVGLVHHGSGPSYTDLSSPDFPGLLATYASAVAKEFPWIEYYTPVNEPLTTARFSGLYGLWYPHTSSTKSFLIMLLNELKATVLAMKEIRKINPLAKLVQTEDLGKTYSTPKLKYQADFENERRWLTYDILCGRVNEQHGFWKIFKQFSIPESDLYFFLDNPCVPDIFGFNHYLTSERYLDEKFDLYPEHTHGGNGRDAYADVEAVRVELEEETGIELLLKEAWERYKSPMAVTEVHLHCHREEQLKWFKQVYDTGISLNKSGIDLRAVTSWALLGTCGWNKLLTEPGGDYEPGAFDTSGGSLRPTALARYIENVNRPGNFHHPMSGGEGWWQRSSRIIYGPIIKQVRMKQNTVPPVLIIGKNGTLGKAFARICESRCLPYQLISRQDCDISKPEEVQALLNKYHPWAVINAAGFVRVDDAEDQHRECMRDNATGAKNLAVETKNKGIKLVSFSSDLVFDGKKTSPYIESDRVHPLNVYGRSKAEAENFILTTDPSALIIRTSAFFSPWDEYNFVHYVKNALSKGESIRTTSDVLISPTYVPDLVNATLDLLIDGEFGIWHLANKGGLSWLNLARLTAESFHLDKKLIHAVSLHEMNYPAPRPANSILGSEKGQLLPTFENAFERYVNEFAVEMRGIAMSA